MIDYEVEDEVAWITLNRPEKLNAVTLTGWESLANHLYKAGEEARVAVITGAGDAFCSGDDINIFKNFEGVEDLEKLGNRLCRAFEAIRNTDVPVIAAVNGQAYGGGCEIVASCDLAVSVDTASFALPETRIGVFPSFAVSRSAEFGGPKRVKEVMFTGDPIDAKTAHDWGLVNRVVSTEALESTVASFVDSILLSPKRSISVTKKHVNNNYKEHEIVLGGLSHLFMSEETNEGIQAFLENRKPSYRK